MTHVDHYAEEILETLESLHGRENVASAVAELIEHFLEECRLLESDVNRLALSLGRQLAGPKRKVDAVHYTLSMTLKREDKR